MASVVQAMPSAVPSNGGGGGRSVGDVKDSPPFQPVVVVSVDVGTARSGYAYAFLKSPHSIECEQPSSGQLKQLTAVLLNADGSFVAFGDAARTTYIDASAELQASWLYFEKFKMCLYSDDLSARPTIKASNGKAVPCVDVFAAALHYFKDEAFKRVTRAANLPLVMTDVQFVVTVPAVWSPGAKQVMREAAKRAGMFEKIESQLILSLESEAASLCCRDSEQKLNASWKPGLRFMVIDLGGGTADVTVHKVTDTHALGEVVASSGGPWGSVYVEDEFLRFIDKIFGASVMDAYRKARTADFLDLMSDFEALKLTVSPTDNKPKRLRLPVSLMQFCQQQTGQTAAALVTAYAKSIMDAKANGSTGKPEKEEIEGKVSPTSKPTHALCASNSVSGSGAGSASEEPSTSLLSHIVSGSWMGLKSSAPSTSTPSAAPASSASSAAPSPNLMPAQVASDAKASKAMDEWEFVGVESVPNVPGGVGVGVAEPSVSLVRGSLKLAPEITFGFFDPVIAPLMKHIGSVLDAANEKEKGGPPITHVFLAGGFSASKMIDVAIRKLIASRSSGSGSGSIRLVTPPHPALAVLKGAAMYGLNPRVMSSRIVKRTYGVAVSCEWNPKKHGDRKKTFRPNNAKMVAFADGIFSPFCVAGDEVRVDHSVSQTYTPGEDKQNEMILKIYQSSSRNVSYIDASDASQAAAMTVQMPDMTGNLQRKVTVTMVFGATEIIVTALDLTSGRDNSVRLSFLDRGFESGLAPASASASAPSSASASN